MSTRERSVMPVIDEEAAWTAVQERDRAQLGVYLRLLDVPVPGSYGPSADEPL